MELQKHTEDVGLLLVELEKDLANLRHSLVDNEDGDDGPLGVRLRVDARFYNDLSLGPAEADDVIGRSNGIEIAFDPTSARRARGLVVDFVTEGGETGFKLDNPRAPKGVQDMTVEALAQHLGDASSRLVLFDVRTDQERAYPQQGETTCDVNPDQRFFVQIINAH